MEMSDTRNSANGVNGSSSSEDAAAPCRNGYVQQVPSDRHQATAGGSPGHAQQVFGSRYRVTARTDSQKKIASWNVNTLYQAGKFENLKKEAE